MSDNEQQPPTPQLTRRQLRELRNTASNPIIIDPDATDEASAVGAEPTPAAAPLPRAAEPVEVPPAPVPQPSVDLGSLALTRRQARLQEKIRTASIPVVTTTGEHAALPGVAESDDARDASADDAAPTDDATETGEVGGNDETPDSAPEGADGVEADVADDAERDETPAGADEVDAHVEDADAADDETAAEAGEADAIADETVADEAVADEDAASEDADDDAVAEDAVVVDETAHEQAVADETVGEHAVGADEAISMDEPIVAEEPEDEPERHVVSEDLGADLLAGESTAADVPASFDQLLSRSVAATGAFTTPNALILAQNPDGGPLVAPVTATGEVLITGTFSLPENFGSTGVVPGAADGKEVDAVLVDGELPASSSPTPVAASAAISTIKSAEDVIRPPAPEKGSRLMVALAITAGALALALAGVLLVSLFTGVFG